MGGSVNSLGVLEESNRGIASNDWFYTCPKAIPVQHYGAHIRFFYSLRKVIQLKRTGEKQHCRKMYRHFKQHNTTIQKCNKGTENGRKQFPSNTAQPCFDDPTQAVLYVRQQSTGLCYNTIRSTVKSENKRHDLAGGLRDF